MLLRGEGPGPGRLRDPEERPEPSDALRKELRDHVGKLIGAIAKPDDVILTPGLPKTRSGKIMRRLLRDVAEGRALGDTTTLNDPGVVDTSRRSMSG